MINSIPATHEERPASVPKRHYLAEIHEGLRFVLGHPVLRAVAACGATAGLFEGIDAAVIVVYLSRTLRASTQYIGLIFSICAVGGLIGAVLAGRLVQRFGSGRVLTASIGLAAPLAVLTVIAQPGWSTVLVGLGGLPLWVGLVIHNTTAFGFRQLICPAHLRGRVNATMRVINQALTPVGALLGGALGVWIGPRATLTIAAAGLSLAVLWLLFSPVARSRDLSEWNLPEA